MEKNRVFFHKPSLELFDSMGLTSVDMHYHSRFSDSYTRIRTIVKKAAQKKIGVAITDHNTIAGNLRAQNNDKGVLVVPGIEVSCLEGPHMLFYFYSTDELSEFHRKHVEPRRLANPYMAVNVKVADLLEEASAYNCVKCAPHPFGYSLVNNGLLKCVSKKYVGDEVFDRIDAMEAICGALNRRLNIRAHESVLEHGKCFTGGTDGHTIFELGRVVTSSYADDLDSFLTSIQKKKNYVIGRETKLLPKILPGSNMLTKHMKYPIPSLRVQYAINKGRIRGMPGRLLEKTAQIRERLRGKV